LTPSTPLPRLIVSDLDGTLLRPDRTVSQRVRTAIAEAQTTGITVAIATARPPFTASQFAALGGITGVAICANGALLYDLEARVVLDQVTLDLAAARAIVAALRDALPGVSFAVLQGEAFGAEDAYARIATHADHGRLLEEMRISDALELLETETTKLIVRHPEHHPRSLLERIQRLGLTGYEASYSGAPFIEIVGAGVTKAAGLERLARLRGWTREEVIAIGDAPNDAPMLAWAGWGVAVANAAPETLAVADEVTASNVDDGVALVIERILGRSDRQS
jgi:Cof subfamily protein (haloacid dehalogenase superfamily)